MEQGGPAEDQGLAQLLALVIRIPEAEGGQAGPQQQVAALDFLDLQVSLALPAPPPKISDWLGRVRSMRSFYASMAGLPPAREGDMPAQAPVSSARQAVVGAALSQVGRVAAKSMTDKDDNGWTARQGWRNLQLYFDTAAGPDPNRLEHLKRKHPGTKLNTKGELVSTDDQLPSWCGIFATWANVAGGLLSSGAWSSVKTSKNSDKTRVPQPGDMVVKSAGGLNHYGVLTWIEAPPVPNPDESQIKKLNIRTVEGNMPNNSEIKEFSGTIAAWDWGVRNPEEI